MVRRLMILGLLLFWIIGCGYYEGVVQPTPISFLSFLGNTSGAVATIDDVTTINLDKGLSGNDKEGKVILLQITPGRHKVVVTRMGQEVVNRVIIVGDGATKEIQVP
ncbi:MAG: hypothetical protein PHN75_07650 [Syntrophales bacterium]|nr:hypothetical protein [Syntrophales bacterium]